MLAMGQGAPRTCRCIETSSDAAGTSSVSSCQGAPRTCRCIETGSSHTELSPSFSVREHHAPVGALRLEAPAAAAAMVREHHAPVGALRLMFAMRASTKLSVREHHAPVGALRPDASCAIVVFDDVREHHAPVGALRLVNQGHNKFRESQEAPRTCRCIETSYGRSRLCRPSSSGSTTHL